MHLFSKGVNVSSKLSTNSGNRLSTTSGKKQQTVNQNQEKTAPQTLKTIERLSAESVQQKQGFRENDSTFARVKD